MPEFNIVVTVDPSRAKAGARQVENALTRTTNRADRLRQVVARTFAAFGAGIGAASVVRTIANFEQAMSTVRAVTQATGGEFNRLNDTAKRLGATTRFSATQAAEGMTFLARAGFDTNEILGSIEGTLRLAQAGALDLGSAADIASNILTGFRLETSRTQEVVDVLALTANSANTDVRQLGDAMKFVAPIAAGVGVSVQEASAAIGALSDAGLQASLAGTGLRRVLSELESPSTKTAGILESLELTVDQVRVSQVGLIDALEALAAAGVDTGLALEIFGDRGGPAFEVLSNNIPKVKELTAAMDNAQGTAQRMAEIMDDNLNGALLRVQSAFEAVILEIGALGTSNALVQGFDALATALRFAADNLDLVVRGLFAFAGALALPRIAAAAAAIVTFGRGVAAAAAAAPTLTRGIVAAGAAVLGLRGGLLAANGAAALLARTLLALGRVAIVGALIEGALLLVDAFRAARQEALGVGDVAKLVTIAFLQTGTNIANAFIGVFDRIRRLAAHVADRTADFFLDAASDVVNGYNRIFDIIQTRLSHLPGGSRTAFNTLPVDFAAERREREREPFVPTQLVDYVSLFFSPEEQKRLREAAIRTGDTLGKLVAERYRFLFDQTVREIPFNIPADFAFELTPGAERRFQLTQEQSEAFEKLRDTLEPLRAAQRQYEDELDLLNTAKRAGVITDREAIRLSELLAKRYREQLQPLQHIRDQITDLQRLRTFDIGDRDAASELLQISQGRTFTAQEQEQLLQAIRRRNELNDILAEERRIYESLRDPVDTYARALATLNGVVARHPELAGRAAQAQRDLRITFLDTQRDLGSGFERALLKLSREFEDFASLAENAMTGWVKSAEDALVEFVQTGKLNFGDLIDTIKADLARLAVRQFITKPLIDAFSGAQGGLKGTFDQVRDVLTGEGCGVLDVFKNIASGVTNLFGGDGLLSNIRGLFGKIGDVLTGEGCGVVDVLKNIAGGVGNIFSGITNALSGVGGAISNVVSGVTNAVSGVASAVGGAVSSVTSALSGIGSAISGAVSSIGSVVSGAVSSIGSVASSVSGGLGSLGSAISTVVSRVGSLVNSLSGAGGAAGGLAGLLGPGVIGGALIAGVLSLSRQRPDRPISDYYDGLGTEVFEVLPDLLNNLAEAAGNLGSEIEDTALQGALNQLSNAFRELAASGLGPDTGLNAAFGALNQIKQLTEAAEQLIPTLAAAGLDTEPFEALISAFRAGQEAMYDAAQQAVAAIHEGFEQSGETVSTAAEGFAGTFNGSLGEFVSMVGESLATGLGNMAKSFMEFIGGMKNSALAVVEGLTSASGSLAEGHASYADAFAAGSQNIGDTLASVESGLAQSMANMSDTVSSSGASVASTTGAANDNMAAAFGAMEGSISQSSASVASTTGAAAGTMASAFGAMEGTVATAAGSMASSMAAAGGAVASAAASAGGAISSAVSSVHSSAAAARSSISSAAASAQQAARDAADSVSQAARDFSRSVPSGNEGGPADAPGSFGGFGPSGNEGGPGDAPGGSPGPGAADDSQPFRMGGLVGYPGGGLVRGIGSSLSDSIFARLSNGEFVVNAASTRQFLPLLEAINDNRFGPRSSSPRRSTGGAQGDAPRIIINDYRRSDQPRPEVRTRRDAQGRYEFIVDLREAVESGELDGVLDRRYGNRPVAA